MVSLQKTQHSITTIKEGESFETFFDRKYPKYKTFKELYNAQYTRSNDLSLTEYERESEIQICFEYKQILENLKHEKEQHRKSAFHEYKLIKTNTIIDTSSFSRKPTILDARNILEKIYNNPNYRIYIYKGSFMGFPDNDDKEIIFNEEEYKTPYYWIILYGNDIASLSNYPNNIIAEGGFTN